MSIHADNHFRIYTEVLKADQETREAVQRMQGVCVFRTEREALDAASKLQSMIKRFVFPSDRQSNCDHHNGFIIIIDVRDGTPQTLPF